MKLTKETLKRTKRTFFQTAVGYIAVNIVAVDFSGGKDVLKTTLIGLGVSGVAAGIAAVMNLDVVTTDDEV